MKDILDAWPTVVKPNRKTVYIRLSELLDEGLIEGSNVGKKGKTARYWKPTEEETEPSVF